MEMQLLTLPLCRGCLCAPCTVKQVGKSQAPLVLLRGDLLPFLFPGCQSSPQMAHPHPGTQLSPSFLDSLMAVPGLFLTHQL